MPDSFRRKITMYPSRAHTSQIFILRSYEKPSLVYTSSHFHGLFRPRLAARIRHAWRVCGAERSEEASGEKAACQAKPPQSFQTRAPEQPKPCGDGASSGVRQNNVGEPRAVERVE
jgi:hypothetical protein